MKRTLTIVVDTEYDDYDFQIELSIIANQLAEGFTSGADANDEGGYSYEIN